MTSILISGNTELFTADALLCLSEEYKVVVAGKTALKERNKNINIYLTSPEEEQFRQLFDVYSFQAVFYISGYADGGEGLFGEIQQLEKVMLEIPGGEADRIIHYRKPEFCDPVWKTGGGTEKRLRIQPYFWSFSDGGDVPLLCGKNQALLYSSQIALSGGPD